MRSRISRVRGSVARISAFSWSVSARMSRTSSRSISPPSNRSPGLRRDPRVVLEDDRRRQHRRLVDQHRPAARAATRPSTRPANEPRSTAWSEQNVWRQRLLPVAAPTGLVRTLTVRRRPSTVPRIASHDRSERHAITDVLAPRPGTHPRHLSPVTCHLSPRVDCLLPRGAAPTRSQRGSPSTLHRAVHHRRNRTCATHLCRHRRRHLTCGPPARRRIHAAERPAPLVLQRRPRGTATARSPRRGRRRRSRASGHHAPRAARRSRRPTCQACRALKAASRSKRRLPQPQPGGAREVVVDRLPSTPAPATGTPPPAPSDDPRGLQPPVGLRVEDAPAEQELERHLAVLAARARYREAATSRS